MLLINEEHEIAKDIMFNKYYYLVEYCVNKYKKYINVLKIDRSDLVQEAMIAFSKALRRYKDDDVSIKSFIAFCIDRRIRNFIKQVNKERNKVNVQSLSLDYLYENDNTLNDVLKSDLDEPLGKLTNGEDLVKLMVDIKNVLSKNEYIVYELLLKGYDYNEIANKLDVSYKGVENTIQRIRKKVNVILEKK